MIKKAVAAFICTVAAASAMVSCGKQLEVDDSNVKNPDTTVEEGSVSVKINGEELKEERTINLERFSDMKAPTIDLENSEVKNFTTPKNGDTIIAMKLKDYDGEIKIRLFPEYADLGVQNFVGLAEKGYYDGLIFHRVISDFMIQGGDPTGTGTGGESMWGGKFDGGTNNSLIHAAGAVAYANSNGTSTDGSQFYIVTGKTYPEEQFESSYPADLKNVYQTAGGAPWLDGGYTIFGQVYQGLDIVFSAQDVKTDSQDKPVNELAIEYVKVGKYEGEELKWFIADYK